MTCAAHYLGNKQALSFLLRICGNRGAHVPPLSSQSGRLRGKAQAEGLVTPTWKGASQPQSAAGPHRDTVTPLSASPVLPPPCVPYNRSLWVPESLECRAMAPPFFPSRGPCDPSREPFCSSPPGRVRVPFRIPNTLQPQVLHLVPLHCLLLVLTAFF